MLLGSGIYYLIELGNSLEICVRNLKIAHMFFTSSKDRVKSTKLLLPPGITEKKKSESTCIQQRVSRPPGSVNDITITPRRQEANQGGLTTSGLTLRGIQSPNSEYWAQMGSSGFLELNRGNWTFMETIGTRILRSGFWTDISFMEGPSPLLIDKTMGRNIQRLGKWPFNGLEFKMPGTHTGLYTAYAPMINKESFIIHRHTKESCLNSRK